MRLFALLILLFFASNAHSQALLLEEGQSSKGVAFGYADVSFGDQLGIAYISSTSDRFDWIFEANLLSNSFNDLYLFAPSIRYFFAKKTGDEGLSLSGLLGYSLLTDFESTAHSMAVGPTLHYEIATGSTRIIPEVGVVHVRSLDDFEVNNTGVVAAANIVFGSSTHYYLTPRMSFADGNSQFSLTFGIQWFK